MTSYEQKGIHMKNYFRVLKNSLYINKLIVSVFYLALATLAIYLFNTPLEKVVATYIVLDIIAIFIINGILTCYKTTYLKDEHKIINYMWKNGKIYLAVLLLTYSVMFFLSNYTTNTIFGNSVNVGFILFLSGVFIVDLNEHRKIYYPLISKRYLKSNAFDKLYLFNNHEGLIIEYKYEYENFEMHSIEKAGIKVEEKYIHMNGVRYVRSQYFRYMKENEIKTLEDLTEEDKLLIAMINIS